MGTEVRLPAHEEGRAVAVATQDDAHLALFLGNLSFLAVHRGEYREARRLSVEAVRLGWALGRRMMAGWTLAEVAGAELGLGHQALAARLIGAADRALELAGVDRHPCDVPEHDRVVAGLRQGLGEGRFADLRAESAGLTLDAAVAMALEESAEREPVIADRKDADPQATPGGADTRDQARRRP